MHQQRILTIQSGTVLEHKLIAAQTFHLKIQSDDFAQMQYVPGFTIDIFLGNPFETSDCEDRKYSFWNYEPVNNVADFAVCTFSNGKGAKWIQKLKQGDIVFFKLSKGKLLADNSVENYLLIGDITSLSHLYQINRDLAVSKTIFSFIYAESPSDFFPDIDNSFPFCHHVITPRVTKSVVKKIISCLPQNLDDTIAYIFGHPEICNTLHNYLKHERNIAIQNLRTKPFWKTDKEVRG